MKGEKLVEFNNLEQVVDESMRKIGVEVEDPNVLQAANHPIQYQVGKLLFHSCPIIFIHFDVIVKYFVTSQEFPGLS